MSLSQIQTNHWGKNSLAQLGEESLLTVSMFQTPLGDEDTADNRTDTILLSGKQWKQWQTLFFGAPKSLQMVTASMKLKDTPWKKSYDQPRQHIKKQRHYFANKGPSSQSYGFPVVMYGCESWTIRKAEHRRIATFKL